MPVFPERLSFRKTSASVALDALRGVAAVLVLLDHCQRLFFVPLQTARGVSAHPFLTTVLYSLSSAGIQAVVIFFVLSGYLISGSVFRSFEEGRWSWKEYLTNRFVRLWLVLLPALMLGGLWDTLRISLAGHAAAAPNGSFIGRLVAGGITWKIFFGNVFFLEGLRTVNFGSDRVLWSLSSEFWYYILFPLGLLAIRPGSSLRTRLLNGAGFLLVAAFLTKGMLALFPVWLLGTALALAKPPKLGAGVRWLALVLYAPCVFGLGQKQWPWHYFKMDYFLGGLTAIFLWVLLSARGEAKEASLPVRAARTVARFSYSLYLVHYPTLLFFAVLLTGRGLWRASWETLTVAGSLCGLALVYGYGIASVTEFHNEAVRRWVEVRMGLRARVCKPASLG
jgi:peptidoglycan/LPS O-acetylase OafA/YrhL